MRLTRIINEGKEYDEWKYHRLNYSPNRKQ